MFLKAYTMDASPSVPIYGIDGPPTSRIRRML